MHYVNKFKSYFNFHINNLKKEKKKGGGGGWFKENKKEKTNERANFF